MAILNVLLWLPIGGSLAEADQLCLKVGGQPAFVLHL